MALLKFLISTLTIGIGYFVLGELGLQLAIPPGYATAIFPATALALIAVLHYGLKALPGIWLGSFAIDLGISWYGGFIEQAPWIAVSIASGATMQAWLASSLVQWRIKSAWQRLDQDNDIFAFLFLAGPIACLCSSSWAVLTLALYNIINPADFAFTWWNWWAGDTLGVLLFAPMLLNLLYRNQPCWQSRLRGVVAPTLFLTIIIVVVYVNASEKDNKLFKYRVAGYGQSLSNQIQQQLQAYTEAVGAIDGLIAIKPNLTQSDFIKFTQAMLSRHTDISALSWDPVITSSKRKAFEAYFEQKNPHKNFFISERDQAGQLVNASFREWYVPVNYIAPLDRNAKALGYDIASNPERLAAIRSAIQSGLMTATSPIQLVQDDKHSTGLLLLQPVYHSGQQPPEMPQGFAVGAFRIEEMLRLQTRATLPANLGFSLEDLQADTATRVIYSTTSPHPPGPNDFIWSQGIDFAGRQWRINLYLTAEFLSTERSLFAWSILATGLIVASMLQAMLLGTTGRAFTIIRRVDQQTREIVAQATILQDHQLNLRTEKERYETLMHASGDGIHILDINGCIVEANQKFCDFLGYSHAEVIGMHVSQWDAFFDHETLTAKMKENFERPNVFETRHRHHNGKIIDVEVSVKAVNLNGQPLLWNASRDISERKRMQQALTRAKEVAEEATKLKSQLLANMSHEIRTPMNGIIGLSELALKLPSSPELHDYLEKIASSSQSLLGILNDILDLSKLEAQGITLEKRPFELRHVIGNLRNLFQHHASSKQLDFIIDIDNAIPPTLIGDVLRLQQILSNLIGNAIKFTEKGHVRVTAKLNQRQATKVNIRLTVEDSGIGMTEEQLLKVFKPFSQGDSSITRRFGGTGLGLAISQHLLQLMESDFDVLSEPGRGSSFSFNLLLDISQISDNGTQKQRQLELESSQLSQAIERIRGCRVLVVEDNRVNQQVVKGFLKSCDVEVVLANHGLEAIEQISAHTFNAVLMDVQMPIMDGLEATRQIRANPESPSVPIIALTAGVTYEERDACLACGMNDLIAKPVTSNALILSLSRWV